MEKYPEIIEYAKNRGVTNPLITYHIAFGYSLEGGGKDEDGWPLVWRVAEECGIAWGCGNPNSHQVSPEKFVKP